MLKLIWYKDFTEYVLRLQFSIFSFAFEAHTTRTKPDGPVSPLVPLYPSSTTSPPPFSQAFDQLIFFLFPLSLCLFSPPALDSNASGLWEIFIHIDRWQSWWVFHECQNSNCFCPTNVSKYQSPEGEVQAGLQIRAIKTLKVSLISLLEYRKQKEKNTRVFVLCLSILSCVLPAVGHRQVLLYEWLKHLKQIQTGSPPKVQRCVGAVRDPALRTRRSSQMIIPAYA